MEPQTAAGRIGLVSVFAAIILTPILFWPTGLALNARLSEYRRKASLSIQVSDPRQLPEAVRQFRTAWNDNFPFRDVAIQADAVLRLSVAGNRWTDRVLIGEDQWLFLRRTGTGTPVTHPDQGFSEGELNAWVHMLETRSAACEAHGSRYVLIVAPDKASIYPDLRPGTCASCDPDPRVDQLLAALRGSDTVRCVDVRPALLSARTADPQLYYRTDTHWNAIGAWHASQAIADALELPGRRVRRDDCLLEVTSRDYHGDLNRLLGAPGLLPEPRIQLMPKTGFLWLRTPLEDAPDQHLPEYSRPFVTTVPDADLPTAVVFRDSFTLELQPFLSQSFSRAVWVWSYEQDRDLVEREQPDLVFDIFVDRQLKTAPPSAFSGRKPGMGERTGT